MVDFNSVKKDLKETQTQLESNELEALLCNWKPNNSSIEITRTEKNVLYYITGFVIRSAMKSKFKSCSTCLDQLVKNDLTNEDFQTLQQIRDFTGKSLINCSPNFFNKVIIEAEIMFRSFILTFNENMPAKALAAIIDNFFYGRLPQLPSCHNLEKKIVKKFLTVRLMHYAREIKESRKKGRQMCDRSSKSIAMRDLAENLW